MNLPLRSALIPKLKAMFPEAAMRIEDHGESRLVFPAKHPSVGDLVIQDDGDEFTLFIGRITHRHFCSTELKASPEVQAEQIASEVTAYLGRLFADQIEFFGTGGSGGARARSDKTRGYISKLFFGRRSYVWSGPLSE